MGVHSLSWIQKLKYMKRLYMVLFIVTIFLVTALSSFAQYSEVGFGAGMSHYWGDLNAPDFPSNFSNGRFAVQLSARYIYKKHWGIRGNFVLGRLFGDDRKSKLEWQKQRNLNFQSPLAELGVMGEFYLFGYETYDGSSVFSPYLTAGISVFRFDPSTKFQGNIVRLQPLGTEGQGMPGFGDKYSLINLAIPIGAGAKFKISERMNISAEVVGRRTFTDFLDDVSKSYVSYEDMTGPGGNGALAARLGNRMNEYFGQEEPINIPTGAQRGGQKVRDYFFISTVSVNLLLSDGNSLRSSSGKLKCTKFCPLSDLKTLKFVSAL